MVTQVRLGRTGLTVSSLCFGTGYLSGPVAPGARLLTRAYDLGVTFWDTYPYTHATCVGITTEAELAADVAIWRRIRRDSKAPRG